MLTEAQKQAWIERLKSAPPKCFTRFRRDDRFCALGHALDLFRPFNGEWKESWTSGEYVYLLPNGEVAASILTDELLDFFGLEADEASRIASESDTTKGFGSVISIIEQLVPTVESEG